MVGDETGQQGRRECGKRFCSSRKPRYSILPESQSGVDKFPIAVVKCRCADTGGAGYGVYTGPEEVGGYVEGGMRCCGSVYGEDDGAGGAIRCDVSHHVFSERLWEWG